MIKKKIMLGNDAYIVYNILVGHLVIVYYIP